MANWVDIVTWVHSSKAEPLVSAETKDTLGTSDFSRIDADNYTVEPNCTLPDFLSDPGPVLRAIISDVFRPWYNFCKFKVNRADFIFNNSSKLLISI